ncbi:MAG: hypothetical protein R2822_23745 [Spirosomataceae bacterium]
MQFSWANRNTVFLTALVLCFQLAFSTLLQAQTFTKDRFVAKDGAVVWTETIEIKDMDTPIMVEALTAALKQKHFIRLDSLQQQGVLSGTIGNTLVPPLSSARFRVDFLYESYIVTVSEMMVQKKGIEVYLLTTNRSFKKTFPKFSEEIDHELEVLFSIR